MLRAISYETPHLDFQSSQINSVTYIFYQCLMCNEIGQCKYALFDMISLSMDHLPCDRTEPRAAALNVFDNWHRAYHGTWPGTLSVIFKAGNIVAAGRYINI